MGHLSSAMVNKMHNTALSRFARAKSLPRFFCLPLLSLPARIRLRILQQISRRMSPHSNFVQFQYSPLSEKLLSRYFRWQRIVVIKNIPPALVYVCTLRQS